MISSASCQFDERREARIPGKRGLPGSIDYEQDEINEKESTKVDFKAKEVCPSPSDFNRWRRISYRKDNGSYKLPEREL
jgi:hypothetical protein